jgi:hypothetical protein
MNADRYQNAGVDVSFMCAGDRHDRCKGVWLAGSADGEWARAECGCACHLPVAVCEHRMKIPHFLGDGSGRMRWTCSDCYADLWMDGS